MVTLRINNTYTHYEGVVYPEILERCTLSQMRFYRIKGTTKTERKEVRRCYFLKGENIFPTGWLFSHIIPVLKNMGLEYTLVDEREKINVNNLETNYEFEPYDYQQEVTRICTTGRKERGIVCIGTGGGKTFVASKIIAYYGQRTLYVVPSLLLLYQTKKVLSKWLGDQNIGIIGDGEFYPSLITIATGQTIWSRKDTEEVKEILHSSRVLILDEAHKISKPNKYNRYVGNTWYHIAMKATNAKIRIGFTATPGKEGSYSNQLLKACTGNILFTKSLSELIMEGYLTKLKVIMYEVILPNQIDNWAKAYSKNIVGNYERNYLIADKAIELASEGKRVLIIVNRIDTHGKVLSNILKDRTDI